MKSVDALRKWADGLRGIWIDPNDHSIIVTTCDDMPPSMGCVSLRDNINGILDNIEREVADMVPLPVDADGVPIHVGDVMKGYQLTIEVGGMSWDGESWSLVDVCGTRWHDCAAFSHHHAPTVEDVLREFTRDWCNAACAGDMTNAERDAARANVVAEYAAKLRLAEDNDGLYEWERDE